MLIVVCIKLVPDPELPIKLDPIAADQNRPEKLPHIINPADLTALEMALRIKEQWNSKVVVLTVGSVVSSTSSDPTGIAIAGKGLRNSGGWLRAPDPLRLCIAMGADRAIAISANGTEANTYVSADSVSAERKSALNLRPLNIDSMMAASVLSEAIHQLGPELVFCGDKSYDQGNGLVGPAIAELLDFSLIMSGLKVTVDSAGQSLKVLRKVERGNRELVRCAIPAVVACSKGSVNPRYPTTAALIASLRSDIEILDLDKLGVLKEAINRAPSLIELSLPRPRTKKIFTPDSFLPPEERARLIMSGGMKQGGKIGQCLEGEIEDMAVRIVNFLQSKGIL